MAMNSSYHNDTYNSNGYTLLESTSIVCASSLITIFAIPSNAIVIFIIAKVQSMRTTTNFLLLNLCIADLLTVFNLPFVTIDLYITGYWIFGGFMCRFVSFTKSIGTKASILILMALSIDRYLTICRPNRVIITTRTVQLTCVVLWTVALGVALPLFICKDVLEEQGFAFCTETWEFSHAAIYTCVLFVLFYLLPLVIMIALYIKIAQQLWRSTKRTRSMRGIGRSLSNASAKSKSRLTKICVVIVMSFALSWAPSHISTMIYFFADAKHMSYELNMIIYPVIDGIAYSNCALNPVLYCFMSQNFRNAIVSEWKRLITRRQQRLYSGLPGMSIRSRTTSTRAQASVPSREIINDNNAHYSSNTSITIYESALW